MKFFLKILQILIVSTVLSLYTLPWLFYPPLNLPGPDMVSEFLVKLTKSMLSNSIMEICWITTLHIQSITQSDCFDPRIPNILETRIIWIYAVLLTSPARDCSPWIPAVFGLSPVTARMGLAEHAFTHYQLTNYKQGVWEHSHNLTGDENSTNFILK